MQDAANQVAFAAFLRGLSEFAERARIEVDPEKLQTNKHAAYTALAWDMIEKDVPDLVKGDMYPFASRGAGENKTDSLLNASAMHHNPQTFLQWIIATADRVASGFEREDFEQYNHSDEGRNHYQTRLLTLFEQIGITQDIQKSNADLQYCYPLKPLSPDAIFPQKREAAEPKDNAAAQQAYRELWQSFTAALSDIPTSHRGNWALWLDHFDTLWQHYTQAIPSATFKTKPEVSLYDHSKTTAALAVALWGWHEENQKTDEKAIADLKDRKDWQEEKILLIQGDFFGIQSFIFASGSDTNKKAAKILRGRSFQVSLFAELAALKILDACGLPPSAQILNAAGKFMIVAPNSERVCKAVDQVRSEINQWFLDHTYGQLALGLATQAASCEDFVNKERFRKLIRQSFAVLETAKLQRFTLTEAADPVFAVNYPAGGCPYDHHLPAQGSKENRQPSALSADQITIGEQLAKRSRLLVFTDPTQVYDGERTKRLSMDIFGYHLAFSDDADITGKFGQIAQSGQLRRCWDFSLPKTQQDRLWHGYARRYINAYVPHFGESIEWDKYEKDDEEEIKAGNVKTFNHLACEERKKEKDSDRYLGNIAIATLKGDVDNLGKIFEKGLAQPTFAKMAALSRQMNHFFSLWLPAYCAEHYPDTYTVFAGGDDFFMIGPWYKTQALAADMRESFKHYVAENSDITFSAGISITKPGLPLPKLSEYAEDALESAKAYSEDTNADKKQPLKNAVCIYGEVVSWKNWQSVQNAFEGIEKLRDLYGLSTGYLYDMLQYCDMAQRAKGGEVQAHMWRSHLYYRTRRFVDQALRGKEKSHKDQAQQALLIQFESKGIVPLGSAFRIPLTNHFYQLRGR